MLENNTARTIFFIGGVIIFGIIVNEIFKNYDTIKDMLNLFYDSKLKKM